METCRAGFRLELRAVDERTLEGIAVPWNETTKLVADPGGERFLPGSLTRTVQDRGARLKLFRDHDHSHAIGKAVKLDPRHADGLWARWVMFDTPAGNDALQEVAQGALDMFSLGFVPIRVRRGSDGVREIVEASAHEVSLCPMGAYDGAQLLATRSADGGALTEIRQWLTQNPVPAVDLTGGPLILRP